VRSAFRYFSDMMMLMADQEIQRTKRQYSGRTTISIEQTHTTTLDRLSPHTRKVDVHAKLAITHLDGLRPSAPNYEDVHRMPRQDSKSGNLQHKPETNSRYIVDVNV